MKFSHTVRMSPKEWSEIRDNPAQRDTAARASRALKTHLGSPSPTHFRVAAVDVIGIGTFKLDGHTRSFLWDKGEVTPPSELLVDVYVAINVDEAVELYKHFDNKAATENALDRLSGACRVHGFFPKSSLIKLGGVTTALRVLHAGDWSGFDVYKDIKPWIPALEVTDERMFLNSRMHTGVIAALLCTVRNYGPLILDFWQKYHDGEGTRLGKERDAVQALMEYMLARKGRGMRHVGGPSACIDVTSKALACAESWMRSGTYIGGIKGLDVRSYVASLPTKPSWVKQS